MTWGNNSVFQLLIIQGSQAITGLFLYNGLGAPGNPPQFAAVASGVTTDPFGNAITSSKILIQGNVITESGGIFRTAAAAPLIQLDGPHNAVLVYDAAAALRETIAPAATNDGLGNTVFTGIVAYDPAPGTGIASQLVGNGLIFRAIAGAAFALPSMSGLAGGPTGTAIALTSGKGTAGAQGVAVALYDSLESAQVTAQVVINTGVAANNPLTKALLEIQGSLALGNVAAPASVAGNVIAFASGSQLRVIDGADGNNYTTERLAINTTANQLINSTTAAVIGAMSFPMSATRTYRFHAHISWVQGATQSQQFFRLIATAGLTVTGMLVSVSQRTQSTTGQSVFDGDLTALNTDTGNFGASGPAAATTNTADFDGIITTNAAGTLNLEARCSNAANTFTIQSRSFAEIMPL